MEGGAWWATVHGVAKSWPWKSNFHFPRQRKTLEGERVTHRQRQSKAGIKLNWTRLHIWHGCSIIRASQRHGVFSGMQLKVSRRRKQLPRLKDVYFLVWRLVFFVPVVFLKGVLPCNTTGEGNGKPLHYLALRTPWTVWKGKKIGHW